MTTFKGHPVGFCNPGCRDKFDRAVNHFERALREKDAHSHRRRTRVPDIDLYRARNMRSHDIWEVADIRFKPYLIAAKPDLLPDQSLVESARQYVGSVFPAICQEEGHHHGLGYIILHSGEMKNWLLVHWWAYGDLVLRTIATSEPGSTEFSSYDHRRFHACVWEHVVINHERDAWVRHMMKETSDCLGYVSDRLPDGDY